jgi:hypothetical protein
MEEETAFWRVYARMNKFNVFAATWSYKKWIKLLLITMKVRNILVWKLR